MNFAEMGLVAVPVITVIAFLAAELVKLVGLDSKWCPVICGCVGGALGVVAMSVMPEYPAEDILTAIAVGIVSGLAATGVHQLYVQLIKKNQDGQDGEGGKTGKADPAEEPAILPEIETGEEHYPSVDEIINDVKRFD